jgi:hypothetical protein
MRMSNYRSSHDRLAIRPPATILVDYNFVPRLVVLRHPLVMTHELDGFTGQAVCLAGERTAARDYPNRAPAHRSKRAE